MDKPEEILLKTLLLLQAASHCLDDIQNLPNQFKKLKTRTNNYNVTLTRDVLIHLEDVFNIDGESASNLLRSIEEKAQEFAKTSIYDLVEVKYFEK